MAIFKTRYKKLLERIRSLELHLGVMYGEDGCEGLLHGSSDYGLLRRIEDRIDELGRKGGDK